MTPPWFSIIWIMNIDHWLLDIKMQKSIPSGIFSVQFPFGESSDLTGGRAWDCRDTAGVLLFFSRPRNFSGNDYQSVTALFLTCQMKYQVGIRIVDMLYCLRSAHDEQFYIFLTGNLINFLHHRKARTVTSPYNKVFTIPGDIFNR